MGFVGKIKEMFTEYDDEYNEELEDAPDIADFDQIKREEEVEPSYDQPIVASPHRAKMVSINTANKLNVVLAQPKQFEEARSIAENLNNHRTVVLNLEFASPELSRRLLDFLSGVAFANHGEVERVAKKTFIILPSNVSLMGNLLDDPEDSSTYFE